MTPTQRDALLALADKWEQEIAAYDNRPEDHDPEDWMAGHRQCLAELREALAAPAAGPVTVEVADLGTVMDYSFPAAGAAPRIDADSDSEYLRELAALLQARGLGDAALPLPEIAGLYEELLAGAAAQGEAERNFFARDFYEDARAGRVAWPSTAASTVADYERELSAVMPADFKDWWQNNKSEWPVVAAGVIKNLREQAELAWEQAAQTSAVGVASLRALAAQCRSDADCKGLTSGYRSACKHIAQHLEDLIDSAGGVEGWCLEVKVDRDGEAGVWAVNGDTSVWIAKASQPRAQRQEGQPRRRC